MAAVRLRRRGRDLAARHWGFKSDVRYYRASGTYNSASPLGTSPVSTSPVTGPGTPPTTGPYSVTGAGMTNVSPVTNATNEPTTPASVALSGLHFWRANVGLAVRW